MSTGAVYSKVKICGLTNLIDAQLACRLGADALGFIVHADSPRQITLATAIGIIQQLPPFVTKVALVVNADKAFLESVIGSGYFNLIQFHGDESADFCGQFNFPYIKCLRLKPSDCIKTLAEPFIKNQVSAILVDKWHAKSYGGQGELLNHPELTQATTRKLGCPLILAGGLNADNVQQRITEVAPYAVDVSTGIEAKTGKKSALNMQRFIQQAKRIS